MKECKRRGQCKPLEMFSPSKLGRDGRHSYCKPCRSEYANAYNKRNRKFPDRVKAPAREEIWPRPLTEQYEMSAWQARCVADMLLKAAAELESQK